MARPLRIEFAGAVYHVIARGNARQSVFLDDNDHRRFLQVLWRVADRLEWNLWAYCLMPNHYHLLIQTSRPTLSCGMRDLNGVYSQTFNRGHQRVGHLFQGRFRSILVEHASHLAELNRYIVLNPFRAGLCDAPEAWRWSSYRATVGTARRPKRLIVDAALAPFTSATHDGREAFRAFVRNGIGLADPTRLHRVPTILGGERFVTRVLAIGPPPSAEVPRVERAKQPLSEFAAIARDRNAAIRAAYASGFYSQQAIAGHFRLHYTTISRIIGTSRFRDAKSKDLTP